MVNEYGYIFYLYLWEKFELWCVYIFFNLKRLKLCGFVFMVLFGCLWILSFYDFLNNKVVNMWFRFIYIYVLSRFICGIVIKNLKSIKNC